MQKETLRIDSFKNQKFEDWCDAKGLKQVPIAKTFICR
jgi:hypothetical protein